MSESPTRAGGQSEASIVLGKLQAGIRQLVAGLGQDAVQAAFGCEARGGGGALTPLELDASAPQANSDAARAAVGIALAMLRPAIGEDAVHILAGNVRRLGDGSKAPNILAAGARTHVRRDPQSRSAGVMRIRVAAGVIFKRVRSEDEAARLTAMEIVRRLGLPPEAPGGVVEIEHALLGACGHRMERGAWDRAKSELTPEQRQAIEVSIRLLTDALSADDVRLMRSDVHAKGAIEKLSANSDPATLNCLIEQTHRLLSR